MRSFLAGTTWCCLVLEVIGASWVVAIVTVTGGFR